MNSIVLWIIGFTALGGFLSVLAAGGLLLLPEQARTRLLSPLVSFAIGAMLGAAFLALLPGAVNGFGIERIQSLALTVLLGLLGFFMLEKMVIWRHCHTHDCEAHGGANAASAGRAGAAEAHGSANAGHSQLPAFRDIRPSLDITSATTDRTSGGRATQEQLPGRAGAAEAHGGANAPHMDAADRNSVSLPGQQPSRVAIATHSDEVLEAGASIGVLASQYHGHSSGGMAAGTPDFSPSAIEAAQRAAAGKLILIGDGIHNLVDGVLIAAAFLTDIHLGIVTSVAVIAHEIPQEVGDFAILLNSGYSRAQALRYNIATSFTTIVGGVIAFFSLSHAQAIVPYVLAIAASSFIYIAVADLIPGLHKRVGVEATVQQVALIVLGVSVIFATQEILH